MKPYAEPSRRRRALLLAVSFEGGLLLLALLLGFWWDVPPLARWRWGATDLMHGLVATIPMALTLLALARSGWPPVMHWLQRIGDMVRQIFGDSTWGDLALIAALAGLGEEALFRGLLLEALRGSVGDAGALLLSSLAFGLAHALDRTYFVFASLAGLYLGGLYLLSDGLLAPTVAHALYDLLALVYVLRVLSR